jgi:hypothetical protein
LMRSFFVQAEIVQQNIPGVSKCGKRAGNQQAPLAGYESVADIENAIHYKQPHKHEMQRHAVGQPMIHVQGSVHPSRKEMKRADVVDIVRPIDQKATPDHEEQQRKVDPMKPADGDEVLKPKCLHSAFASLLPQYP